MTVGEFINRLKGNKTLVNGVVFSIFSFAGRGIAFVLLVILARYIPPSDYGKLSLFNTAIMLIGFLLTFQTSGYFGISYFKEDKKTFHQDFTFIVLMLLLTAGIVALIFGVFGEYLSKLVAISYDLLWWALVIALTNVPFSLLSDYYRLQEKVKMYGLLNLGNAIMNAIFSLVLVITFAQGWMGRVNTHIGINLIFFIISLIFFVHKGFFDFHIKKGRMKIILLWGVPQIPHMMTNWIRQGCDQYIINYSYSTQEVGLFSFALNLVGIIIMIGVAFNSSNSVTIYQILSSSKTDSAKRCELSRNTRNLFFVYLVTTIITILFGCILTPFVLPQYVESIPYFVVLSLYGFMVCMYFLFCNYLFYYGFTKNLMFITFGTSILHLFLSLLLTHYSMYFTTIIYVVSQSLCAGIVYCYSRKILKKELLG